MPTYNLEFAESALKEWEDLDGSVKKVLKRHLEERLRQPHVPGSKLRGAPNRYKIKLRKVGYRLVYDVDDTTVTVLVLAVARRDEVYDRLPSPSFGRFVAPEKETPSPKRARRRG